MEEIMNYLKGVLLTHLINILQSEQQRCTQSLMNYGPDSDYFPTGGEMRIYLENQIIYASELIAELKQKLKSLNAFNEEEEEEEENWNIELNEHIKNINENEN